ncbi:MAG: hypothetical protein KAU46_12600 [Candidatus Aminicenantes bacterium]|nr:hypothetical protein [Candidatus Aminicenantes bacterium]
MGFCYTEDEIVIHSYLMRGFHDGLKPKKLIPGKPNYGKVWVDKQDGSILKMEIEAESLAGYEKIRADLVHNKEILEEDYDEKNYFAASILIDF